MIGYSPVHILILLMPYWCSGIEYYVSPSPGHSCPSRNCITLPQFASNSSQYCHSNTSLIFLPGDHSLSEVIRINGISLLSLSASTTMLRPQVICVRMSRFELCNITMVQLSGVDFTGCSGNKFKLLRQLSIEFTSFQGKGNHSRAVSLIQSNAIIEKNKFVGSTQWENHKPSSTGGAIIMTGSVVTIKDCTFEHNNAEVGGAIYGELSYIELVNSSFTNNHASGNSTCFGGALYAQRGCSVKIYNSTFSNNSAYCTEELDSAGGSIAIEGGAADIHIIGTEFYHNNAVHGGAIAMVEAPIMIRKDFRRYTNDANIVTIKDSIFNWNTADKYGGVLWIEKATISIHNGIFKHNNADSHEGGVLYMLETTTDVRMSLFKYNKAGNNGGVISAERCTMLNVEGSYFISNKANLSGGVLNAVQTFTSFSDTFFVKNKAVHSRGGAILLYLSALNISQCNFRINIGAVGGAVALERIKTVIITWTTFSKNFADLSGGAISIYDSLLTRTVSICKSQFTKNIANIGGAMYARGSLILLSDSNFYENMAEGGIFQIFESTILFSHNISFINNMGSLFLFSSDFMVTKGTNLLFTNNSFPLPTPKGASSIQQGGAITAFQSNITLHGNCSLAHNYAKNGGAMHISQSKVFAYSSILILTNNSATHRGGGVYLYQSEWNCKEHSTLKLIRNSANMTGGGIHATSSLVFIDHVYDEGNVMSVQFVENNAEQGGGLYLEVNAKFHVLKRLLKFKPYDEGYISLVLFYENTADYGGAVFIADDTNSAMCSSFSFKEYSAPTECSIQTLTLHGEVYDSLHHDDIIFARNYAYTSGTTLFGGLLDRCTVSPFAEIYNSIIYYGSSALIDGVTNLKSVSTITNVSEINSHPVKVRFCKDNEPDIIMQSLSVDVQKGATFTITLVALDQVNRQVNATIHSSLSSSLGGLGENQSLQTSIDSCSDVSYNIFSPHDFETLILYADGPCKDATLSRTLVNITFKTCTCPIGFQQNRLETTKCTCECDHKLRPYISECHQQSRMLARMGTFWVTHINFSHDLNEYEYLIYPHCPLDYCYPPTLKVYINLGMERGSDEQCNYNRSGILCGRCRTNFSLSLGSSKCIQCPLHWPLFCTLIILAFLLAGIALVATILYLNLTVATGVLNGIILYANIINANSSTFLPFNERNFVTVFIAWLNLELGIDTCLFEGMDTYWKTLLQLAFPSYVIILVIMVILISERSTRFASLIGRKNPVATLATLILFSYARFLHSIITILSFSVLEYPDGSYEVVWLSDGTINYLKGKHIFLFFIAVLVLLFGGTYTALLFFWQWLIYYQNKIIFRWVRYHRFRLFLEPYHAPYTFKHRYWTGLLLLVRVILYLASALNVSGDPGINLLVTGLVMVSLFLLKSCLERVKGPIYKSWPVDALETSCHINIIFLSFARFYTLESNKDQSIVAYISGTMVLILLLAVLVYNIFIQVCPMTKLHKMRRDFDEVSLMDYQPAESILGDQPHPTVSWIDAPSCKEQSLSAIVSNCESEKSDKNI